MRKWTRTITISLFVVGSVMIARGAPRAEEVDEPAYSDRVDLEDYETAPRTIQRDSVSAPLMVSLAYGCIWLLTVGFLFSLWTRGKRLSDEVAAANGRLDMLDKRLKDLAGEKTQDQEN